MRDLKMAQIVTFLSALYTLVLAADHIQRGSPELGFPGNCAIIVWICITAMYFILCMLIRNANFK